MSIKQWLVPAAVALALVGCAGQQTSTPATSSSSVVSGSTSSPLSGTVKVTINNFTTTPQTLVVKKGTVIEVINNEISGHSLTADDDSFDTGILGKGKSANVTMTSVGTFTFHCTPHSSTKSLQGTITVVE